MTSGRAIVVGAGIGGLSAAIALRQAGYSIDVFERNADVREIGAGLSFWSNGLQAVRELGGNIEKEVLAAGAPIDWLENADWKGRPLQRIHVGRLGRHVAIQRPDLLAPLLKSFGAPMIQVDHALVRIRQDAGGVTAIFENGVEARGDFLVGADGIFSAVRRELHPDIRPAYAGHVAWRGIAAFAHPRFPVGVALSLMGRGKHFAVEPITQGRVFWYATKNLPEATDAPTVARTKDELQAHFDHCGHPVRALIAATPVESIFRNRVYDVPAARSWGRGRVTLLGDAAHAMRPNLGQGACQAVEDSVVLGRSLQRASDPEAALRVYEARRRRRTRWVVYWSKQISRLEHADHVVTAGARDLALRLTPGVMNLPWFSTILAFDPH